MSILVQPPSSGLAHAWERVDLPPTWPDASKWRLFLSLLKAPTVRGGAVSLPSELPGPSVPEYALRPFHGQPNGYYSHSVAAGYDTGFELSMLKRVVKARERLVSAITRRAEPGTPVLDLGCGTGRLAMALANSTEPVERTIWGIDPSPYLLKLARVRCPSAHLLQGIAEEMPFSDGYFGAVGACFLFHELPAPAARRAIVEVHRVLRPGGILTLVDPCQDHIRPRSYLKLVRRHGLLSLYFHLLARGVYEPFLQDWHALGDHEDWLREHGFELLERKVEVPFEYLIARRLDGSRAIGPSASEL